MNESNLFLNKLCQKENTNQICSNYTYRVNGNDFETADEIIEKSNYYETIDTRLIYAHESVVLPTGVAYEYDEVFKALDPDGYDAFIDRQISIAINDLKEMIADAVNSGQTYCEYEDVTVEIIPKESRFPYSVKGYYSDGTCFMTAGAETLLDAVTIFFSEPEIETYIKEQIQSDHPYYRDEKLEQVYYKRILESYQQILESKTTGLLITTDKGNRFIIERK